MTNTLLKGFFALAIVSLTPQALLACPYHAALQEACSNCCQRHQNTGDSAAICAHDVSGCVCARPLQK